MRRHDPYTKSRSARSHRAWVGCVSPVVRFVAVCGLLWGGGYAFSRYLRESDDYRVKQICVEGASVLSPAAIIQASHVTKADNILFLDSREISERVQTLPRVKSCVVTRIFPDVVALTVVERIAVATLLVDNRTYEVDASGAVLEEIVAAAPYTGPLISLYPPLSTVTPGQRVDRPELKEALAVWDAYAQSEMCQDAAVSELAVYDESDIRMYCEGLSFEIRWGRGDYHVQARRLDILWEELHGYLPCTAYLDLRFGPDLACK